MNHNCSPHTVDKLQIMEQKQLPGLTAHLVGTPRLEQLAIHGMFLSLRGIQERFNGFSTLSVACPALAESIIRANTYQKAMI